MLKIWTKTQIFNNCFEGSCNLQKKTLSIKTKGCHGHMVPFSIGKIEVGEGVYSDFKELLLQSAELGNYT
jgi:hypothetical protein